MSNRVAKVHAVTSTPDATARGGAAAAPAVNGGAAAAINGNAGVSVPMSPQGLAAVLHLAQRAQAAGSVAELGFTLVNETLTLADFRQAAFFTLGAGGKPRLATASGLASVTEDSPYAVWLNRLAATFPRDAGCHRLDFAEADAPGSARHEHAEAWAEWLPDHLLAAPLLAPDGDLLGFVMYARDEPWRDAERALLDVAHQHAAYCLWSLSRQRAGLRQKLAAGTRSRWLRWGVPALLLALLVPVRLSALAPAEVVALNALAIAAPQDGVVAKFHVQPNAPVKAGDLLFSLDDTTLQSRREVAAKGLQVARADLLNAQQRAFDDLKSKGELAAAAGRVREKEAELALTDNALARVAVRADRSGVAVFADANDWVGRTVQTGERVMQIADPKDAGVLVWLPAADALNLEPGAPVRLFLHTQPLHPLSGALLQTSYQAVPSPDGVSAYRLRATFDNAATGAEAPPRIGLRGTARVSGDWSVLGYYVLRRPIAAVREWTGL
jgi:hypothetical protein